MANEQAVSNGKPHRKTDEPDLAREQAPPEPVFRAHDEQRKKAAKSTVSDPTAAKLGEVADRLDEITQRLAAVMASPGERIAAFASPSPAKSLGEIERIAEEVGRVQAQGRLSKKVLANGDISYSLPLDSPSAHMTRLVGLPREAFVHHAPESDRSHIELVGQTDRQMLAAMEFAKRQWGDEGVVIHVGDKHRDKVIEHAVRAGLNVANKDVEMQALVAAERERQAHPILRDRSDHAREHFPLLERVGPEPERTRAR